MLQGLANKVAETVDKMTFFKGITDNLGAHNQEVPQGGLPIGGFLYVVAVLWVLGAIGAVFGVLGGLGVLSIVPMYAIIAIVFSAISCVIYAFLLMNFFQRKKALVEKYPLIVVILILLSLAGGIVGLILLPGFSIVSTIISLAFQLLFLGFFCYYFRHAQRSKDTFVN